MSIHWSTVLGRRDISRLEIPFDYEAVWATTYRLFTLIIIIFYLFGRPLRKPIPKVALDLLF